MQLQHRWENGQRLLQYQSVPCKANEMTLQRECCTRAPRQCRRHHQRAVAAGWVPRPPGPTAQRQQRQEPGHKRRAGGEGCGGSGVFCRLLQRRFGGVCCYRCWYVRRRCYARCLIAGLSDVLSAASSSGPSNRDRVVVLHVCCAGGAAASSAAASSAAGVCQMIRTARCT